MFKCSGCGVCCHHVDRAVESSKDLGLDFPYGWNEDGKCDMLGDDNKCTVYDKRPLLCNVDKLIEVFDIKDKEGFYELNKQACNAMMGDAGIDLAFRL